jgi:hypothetical protein
LCSGDKISRNDLRCRSLQAANVFPQIRQSSRPGKPFIEFDSAIKYDDPHFRQVTSEIFMTRILNAQSDRGISARALDARMTVA